jgi:hypothetical protein
MDAGFAQYPSFVEEYKHETYDQEVSHEQEEPYEPYAKPLPRTISTQSPLNSPLDIKRTCADIGKKRGMQDTSRGSRLILREKAGAEKLLDLSVQHVYSVTP